MLEETPVVLVVEDDPDLAGLYAGWLREGEYAVRVAHDERAALAAVDEADAVVLGERSPDLSPGALLDAFEDRDADVPTVVVTADDGRDAAPASDDHLVEPVSAEALRDAVSGLLARRAYSQGVAELFSVAAEKAAIESGREEGADERRRELDERLDELRERVDDTLDSLVETSGFTAAYRAVEDGNGGHGGV